MAEEMAVVAPPEFTITVDCGFGPVEGAIVHLL